MIDSQKKHIFDSKKLIILIKLIKFVIVTHQQWWEGGEEHASLVALRICVFAFLLIEISSRKAVPEVTSTFTGPLHYYLRGLSSRATFENISKVGV